MLKTKIFKDEEIETIRKNFIAIRRALGYETVADFAAALDKDQSYVGLSRSTIERYEMPSRKSYTRDAVLKYSQLSLCSFEMIVKGDLAKELPPDSLVINDFAPSELNSEKDLLDMFNCMFPIFTSYEPIKNPSFLEGLSILERTNSSELFSGEDVDYAIKCFASCSYPEAKLNILSLVGRFYVLLGLSSGLAIKTSRTLDEKQYDNLLQLFTSIEKKQRGWKNEELITNCRKEFLSRYNNYLVTDCMNLSNYKSKVHIEYIYYYLAIRYLIGFMDTTITRTTLEEMSFHGKDMIYSLSLMKNRFAVKFQKLAENN